MRRESTPGLVALAASVASVAILSSCAVQGLAFKQDGRIEFVAPGYREKVTLPFTIRWSVADFELTGATGSAAPNAGYIQVLFDKDPQPPGEGVDYFARNDVSCREADGCPDRHYLAQRGIFTTTDTFFIVRALPPAPGVDLNRGEPDIHDVILVLLDGQGRRIGESVWWNTFEVVDGD